MIKLLLADNSIVLLNGLQSVLEGEQTIEIVGRAHDGIEVLQCLTKVAVDVILMDINMPNKDGIEATREVTKHYPNIKILALTMYNEGTFIKKMLSEGAAGYLLKNAGKQEILTAIQTVFQGKIYASPEISNRLNFPSFQKDTKVGTNFIPSLSRKEKIILRLIIEHYNNSEIAQKLFMSIRIVEMHRKNILNKVGVTTTSNLVKIALEEGLI